MFKVDIHTHIIPEHLPDLKKRYGYGGFIRLDHHKPCCARMMMDNKFFREIEDNAWSPETRVKECDHDGVDVQVLSTIPVMFAYWARAQDTADLAMFLNDHIMDVVSRYPDRFIGLGTLPMQHPKLAIKELERIMKNGMAGIQIGTHINDWNLNAPEVFEVLEAAERLNASVFIHPWDMMAKEKMPDYWLPWLVGMPAESSLAICSLIFGGVLERLPKLRLAFAHGGGSFPATIGRIQHGFNVRPDLCAVDNPVPPENYLGKFYVDSLVHDPAMLHYLVQLLGEDHIVMGSDYPFPLGEAQPGSLVESADLPDSVKSKILGNNAMAWLGVEQKSFAS